MYVCNCNAVTDNDIKEEVALGATSMGCLRKRLGVASQCGGCADHAEETLFAALNENGSRNVMTSGWKTSTVVTG